MVEERCVHDEENEIGTSPQACMRK